VLGKLAGKDIDGAAGGMDAWSNTADDMASAQDVEVNIATDGKSAFVEKLSLLSAPRGGLLRS
jgi:hypothetical protein